MPEHPAVPAMCPRERLLAAVRRQEVDRVPVRLWGIDPFASGPREPSYRPLYELVEQHCDQIVNWMPPAASCPGLDFGFNGSSDFHAVRSERPSSRPGYREQVTVVDTPRGALRTMWLLDTSGGPGRVAEYPVKSPEDARAFLSIPWEPLHPPVESFFALERKLGGSAVAMVDTCGDPVYQLYCLLGSELLALWSVERRDLILELMEALTQRWLAYVSHLVQAGVGPLFGVIGPEVSLPPLLSPRDFDELVVRVDSRMIDIVHDAGGLVWVHCHGKVDRVLERFIAMGVDCLNPVEPPPMGDITLSEAKRRSAGRLCLEGNVEIGLFETMDPVAFRALCAEAVLEGKPGGGYIYCPTSTPRHWPRLPPAVVESYRIFVEVGRTLGEYR